MSSAAVALVNESNELSCVLIPTPGEQLLLPNVSVAEIVPWRRIKPLENGPSWCMGFSGWRGQTIAVLNYAGFAQDVDAPAAARCMVVMNRARSTTGPAFYALAAQGLPRMVQLVDEDLGGENLPLGPADVMKVTVGTEVATIPDLAYIERCVGELSAP